MDEKTYNVTIDTGGTFTDCLACTSGGAIVRRKVLSSGVLRGCLVERLNRHTYRIAQNWALSRDILAGYQFRLLDRSRWRTRVSSFDPQRRVLTLSEAPPETASGLFEISAGEEAPLLAIRLVTETGLTEPLPPLNLRLGTTRGTNALLERSGGPTVCIVTKGFADLFAIGTQQRPNIFALAIKKPPPLCEWVVELDERIDAQGQVLRPPDWGSLHEPLLALRERGVQVAVGVLIHAWKNPVHESGLRDLLTELGFRYISLSSELSQQVGYYGRAQTTVVNGYLAPVIRDYVDHLIDRVGRSPLQIMTSAGGLVRAEAFRPVDSLLSGPAGGVVGAAAIGRACGCERVIAFDMGGTSTDVSRYDGGPDYTYELTVAATTLFTPALRIETVAAGGGSICGFDGYKLTVGPASAGADPGPACYGAGGPLCITDVNLLAGRLDASRMGMPLNPERARQTLEERIDQIEAATGTRPDLQQLIDGYLAVANEIMAGAVKTISVAQGYEPASFALVAFGGAGGMHACALASLLGIKKILLPADAGLLSAYGLGQARVEHVAERAVIARLDSVELTLAERLDCLQAEARAALSSAGVREEVRYERRVFLRFEGQNRSLEIPYSDGLREAFRAAYEGLYGHWDEAGVLEVEHLRVTASTMTPWFQTDRRPAKRYRPQPDRHLGRIPVYDRDRLTPGAEIRGLALLVDSYSTAVVEENWQVTVDGTGTAIFNETRARPKEHRHGGRSEQAALELYANRMQQVAESMGAMLRRTARSVNVKDRLDFSCALLDAQGYLVANAQHIPVHLGGMGLCARRILAKHRLGPGDAIVTNHPAWGGSHLSDVTLLSPVYIERELIGYCINRAHHAEIGGVTPGSMPPRATRLLEEGVVIEPFYLIRGGRADWQGMRTLLEAGPWPSRMVAENLADLNAQLAANQRGAQELSELARRMGTDALRHYAAMLRQNAAGKVSRMIDGWERTSFRAEERLDDGSLLRVVVTRENAGKATLDFTGSAAVHPGNLNGTEAVCTSVIMYVLRLLVDEPIPLNDGMLDPITVILPEGILCPPFGAIETCPAVAGGNVELSQRLTDTLLKAFGVAAASQGTMNNLLFGNERFGYYETIGGGCGAIEGHAGADGVHQHMTNTRITDVEVLEQRYPVRLRRFALRPQSGGVGQWRGGRGIIRELEFLEPVTLSLLAQRRNSGPYGLQGGGAGSPGRQSLVLPNGQTRSMPGDFSIDVAVGTRLVVETPGGGAVGSKIGNQ